MAAPLELTRFVYPISFPQGIACVREPDPHGPPKPRLLDRVRAAIRARHYSRRTEEAAPEISRFLTRSPLMERWPPPPRTRR